MRGLEGDTIGGFNSMLARQKREPGECLVSTVLFDNETEPSITPATSTNTPARRTARSGF